MYADTVELIACSAPCLSVVCLPVSVSVWQRTQTPRNLLSALPPVCLLYVCLFLYLFNVVFRHCVTYCLLCPLSVCCPSACFSICLTTNSDTEKLIACSAPCCLSTCLYLFWRRIQTLWNLLSALPSVCLLYVYLFVSVLTTYPDAVELVVR
jgi:hypothetical protein